MPPDLTRVLVVEGEPVVPSLLSYVATEHGFVVRTAGNASEVTREVQSPIFALTPQVAWSLVELASWELFPTLAPTKKTMDEVRKQLQEQVAVAVKKAVAADAVGAGSPA